MRRFAMGVALLLLSFSAYAQRRGAVDWIFLVDTSKSMNQNHVFEPAKRSLETFVREASDGDSVAIMTFDSDVKVAGGFDLGPNRDDALAVIHDLEAKGNRTHLGKAIARGLDRAERPAAKDRTRAIVLFTDGREDVRGLEDVVPIPSTIDRALKSGAHIFFVSMGEHDPQLRAFPNAKFLEATDPEAIRRVTQEIRTLIEPPPPPPPPPKPKPRPVVVEPPNPSRAKWLIPLALLIAAAAAALALRKRPRLEGEIEIVQPRVANSFIGLPALAAKEVVLSSIVPLDALAGSDARLFVRNKRVWIAAQAGSLRVNDLEVPTAELYDADTIEVGDARLRFNHIGHTRPQEDQP